MGPEERADLAASRPMNEGTEFINEVLRCSPHLPCPLLRSYCFAHTFIKNNKFMVCCCCCLVPQSYPTLWDPMDCSLPGSSVHGISQARILEWVAIFFSWGSSWPRDQTHVFCIDRRVLYSLSHQGSPSWSVKIHYNVPQASLHHISHLQNTWETHTSVSVSYFCC